VEQERIWDHFQTVRVDSFDHARGRYAAMVHEVERRLGRTPGRVLNIGIGAGGVERRLKQRGWHVASLDPSNSVVSAMVQAGVDARCGYAQQMPFDSGSFDVVIASEVLEHIQPAMRALVQQEVARVLTDHGWFVGSVPYRENLADGEVICPDCGKVFHRWGHVSSFDIASIESELGLHFEVVSCRRLSFVDWESARPPVRFVKAVIQHILGRLGEPIASPSIVFAVRKRPAG
jgi:SAM-dependent methyltransferase